MPNPQIFLRQKNTGLYSANNGGWAAHSRDARNFSDLVSAQTFANSSGLTNLEIVVKTNPGEYCIPVTDPAK
jgi:hypothetical protein